MNDHVKGILFILLAALGFAFMSFFVKLAGNVPTMQKAFFRNIVAVLIASVSLVRYKGSLHVDKRDYLPLFLRSLFGTIGLIFNFWAISRLALPDANILNKMSPFFAVLMSIFILGERPNSMDILTVIVAFVGAMFVVKPTAGLASLPAIVGLIGGMCAGTAYTFVRKLGKHNVPGPLIVFVFSAFSSIVCLIPMLMDYQPMTFIQLLCLILAGCSAALGQFSVTAAYTFAPAKEISVFDYSQVIYAAILGFLVFHEWPDRMSLIGYVLIIGTAIVKWYLNTHGGENETVQE
ncbi:MAG: DMT family transporter [Absicoccus porci]|jgi:drug/metabolite transporter (DMT)-like permease|uniref:DMT family transporter n=1 Tax=Absicoccus porci TaxID=2486576 RepID=A0A3N0HZI2_9FIRM|nr:DMT family transporter [Absicoccus porci]MCI6088583.1 DMT family transporter [Absicoccus porci]MDD7330245.1 DMT family transporter [Absicoccus porci]MDY4738828.1 DMT family transporter [Absicoccus porci]MEE1355896.1 DMT family transporter [Absicoccus porci]RNM30151.1 DMT family transporter [Absicoccus porci]